MARQPTFWSFSPTSLLADQIRKGPLPGEHPTIGRVGIGLAGRADSPVQDIGTVEAFRQVLLSADSLIFNTVAPEITS